MKFTIREGAEAGNRPPLKNEHMSSQEHAKGGLNSMNLALFESGPTATLLIRGSMLTTPIAVATASFTKAEGKLSLMEVIKMKTNNTV